MIVSISLTLSDGESAVRVIDLEEKLYHFEKIRVVVRAPRNTEVGDYTYERMASGKTTVKNWIENRLRPILGDLEFEVVPGSNPIQHMVASPHMTLESLRSSYAI